MTPLVEIKDRNLAENALTEQFTLKNLAPPESSKATSDSLQGRGIAASISVRRVARQGTGDTDMLEGDLDKTITE